MCSYHIIIMNTIINDTVIITSDWIQYLHIGNTFITLHTHPPPTYTSTTHTHTQIHTHTYTHTPHTYTHTYTYIEWCYFTLQCRGAATGGGVTCPPTLKSRGTSYVLVPPTFTTQFILNG